MAWNEADAAADARPDGTLIGIFRNEDEATRAVVALRKGGLEARHVGASLAEDHPPVSGSRKNAGQWFGELREIFHEGVNPQTTWRSENLERLLVDMGPHSEGAARVVRQAGPESALVAVRAEDRWREAKKLMEEYGGRIEFIQSPSGSGRLDEPVRRDPVDAQTPSKWVDEALVIRQVDESTVDRQVEEPVRDRIADEARVEPASRAAGEARSATAPVEGRPATEPGHIKLYGEDLHIHKDKVGSGDVRVRKESVTQMETIQVPVTREHLVVEHTDGSPESRAEEIRIPLSEERVRVDKEMRLSEEYKVGKREVTENEPVTDSVRRERLLIDDDAVNRRE